ncbi:hypothetical protein D3C87_245660 [compost metagenome]
MILMYGFGGIELVVILLIIIITALIGYRAGSERKIGGPLGLLLTLFLNFIGLIIIWCSPRIDEEIYVDVPDQLKKFKDLLDSGAITEDEYKSQKDRLLKLNLP